MAKAWARKEAKTNEIAAVIEKGVLWVKFHPQTALWSAITLIAAALLAAGFANKVLNEREESWSRYAIAQSYAYSKQPDAALEQIRDLARNYPSSVAASYALLLAGDILYEQGKFSEAAASYEQVAQQPNHKETLPLARANLGIAREAAGDCKSAQTADQTFLDAHSDHFLAPQVHASLARCLALLGENEKAKATYERMAFLYPETYWAAWAKARLQ